MSRNRLLSSLSVLLFCCLVLAACGGGGPRKRVFPPSASVQELTVEADGRWTVALRLQNFSNVTQRFGQVTGTLRVGGHDAGPITLVPDLAVGPESVEIFDLQLAPSPAAAQAVADAIATRRSVRYALDGTITSVEPSRRSDRFEHDSQLTPVPGLAGVLR